MIKKSLIATVALALMCVFAMPAQAQFGKKIGKSLGKAAKDAGKAATDMATEAATEMGANKVSDKVIDFMDTNNVVATEESEYYKRLSTVIGTNYTSAEGKPLTYKIYESDEANIIALNNGQIRIYTGMMDILTDTELQALLALQAGHIASGNTRANLMKVASGDNATSAGGAQVEKMMAMSGDQLGTVVNELLQVPYTVEQNTAADKFAKTYLQSQGADSSALSELLSKFAELKNVDLESDDLDEEATEVIQASNAAKFIGVNAAR